jgi:hypothetical protein
MSTPNFFNLTDFVNVKVQLSLWSFTYVVRTYGGVEDSSISQLLVLDTFHVPGKLSGYLGGWVGPRAGLENGEKI